MRTPEQIIGKDALDQLAFEGYAVVPVEPTEDMLREAMGHIVEEDDQTATMREDRNTWLVMVRAAQRKERSNV